MPWAQLYSPSGCSRDTTSRSGRMDTCTSMPSGSETPWFTNSGRVSSAHSIATGSGSSTTMVPVNMLVDPMKLATKREFGNA
ncbi:hypothetical protein G6F59_018344 [Rhizopus arrhizus]|nr:hypothetical protein G6F59_018344 [Rhizopus arrhizus]